MNDPVRKNMRFINTDSSELLIEAVAAEKNSPQVFHTITFKSSAIEYLVGINEKASALVLRSEVTIPVALPYKQLRQMIYEPDLESGSSLDLTQYTGKAAGNALAPTLTDGFNQKAGLQISAILREDGENKTINYSFSEEDVSSYELQEDTRSKCGESVTIHFNAAKSRGPFGTGYAVLDMSHQDFTKRFAEAKRNKQSTLDLFQLFAQNPSYYGFDPE